MVWRYKEQVIEEDKVLPELDYTPDPTLRLLAESTDAEAVYQAFGGKEAFDETLKEIHFVDRYYGKPQLHRDFFTAASGKGHDLAYLFEGGALAAWNIKSSQRPSLPALAEQILDTMGIQLPQLLTGDGLDRDELALARALMLVAARAEMIRGEFGEPAVLPPGQKTANGYHNAVHTGYVAVIANYQADYYKEILSSLPSLEKLLRKELLKEKFSRKDLLKFVVAAMGHDADHWGGQNPPGKPFAFEEYSVAVIDPLLDACGVSSSDNDDIDLMILSTSPDGPADCVKAMSNWLQSNPDGPNPRPEDVDPGNHFPQLHTLCSRPAMVMLCRWLSHADNYASSAAGVHSSQIMSQRLTDEFIKAGGRPINLVTDDACLYYLMNGVGADGYADPLGQECFGEPNKALQIYAQKRVQIPQNPIESRQPII